MKSISRPLLNFLSVSFIIIIQETLHWKNSDYLNNPLLFVQLQSSPKDRKGSI